MPPGDAQRVWFPEMLADLRAVWTPTMTWAELADFCQLTSAKRRTIRQERGIRPPQTRCPGCGEVSRSDIRGVSIRSALFALKKLEVVTESEFKVLDRSWKKHRAAAGFDPYGQPAPAAVAASAGRSSRCC